MGADFATAGAYGLTLEQHRALTATRDRPLTDPAMSNAGASRLRAEAAATYESPIDAVLDLAEKLAASRRARESRNTELLAAMSAEHPTTPAYHGTSAGYRKHLRRSETACDACRAAHASETRARKANARARRAS